MNAHHSSSFALCFGCWQGRSRDFSKGGAEAMKYWILEMWSILCRGAARIFLRGGAEVVEAKALKKEKLLVIRIVKEST